MLRAELGRKAELKRLLNMDEHARRAAETSARHVGDRFLTLLCPNPSVASMDADTRGDVLQALRRDLADLGIGASDAP